MNLDKNVLLVPERNICQHIYPFISKDSRSLRKHIDLQISKHLFSQGRDDTEMYVWKMLNEKQVEYALEIQPFSFTFCLVESHVSMMIETGTR